MNSLQSLFDKAKNNPNSLVSVAVAQDEHVLEACVNAKKMGYADFVLVGDETKIVELAAKSSFDLTGFQIIDEKDDTLACAKAVSLVKEGKASALMKGLVDTSVIMKAALDKENGIRTGRKLSHMAAFEVSTYHKLLFVTDAAINVAPDLEAKKEIIQNSVEALNNLGLANPKVALLAAKEKVDPKMPVTEEYAQLVEMNKKGDIPNCILAGPLALDNAVSKESARIKKIEGPVAADADVLFCPDIEAGNILYKTLAFLTDAKNGGVVLGAKRPIILTSRADSSESKLISIILGVLF